MGPFWEVETGRRDGRVSNFSEPLTNLPPFFANISQLISMFRSKGLSVKDLVVLSGTEAFHLMFFVESLVKRNCTEVNPNYSVLAQRWAHHRHFSLLFIQLSALQLHRKGWHRSHIGLRIHRKTEE